MSFSSRHHPMQLKLAAIPHGEDVVITLDGALSAGDAVAAQVELLNLTATCTGRIVLDCTKLTYVASMGLRALLALHRNATGRSKGVCLACLSEPVSEILKIAGFHAHFATAPTVEQALVAKAP